MRVLNINLQADPKIIKVPAGRPNSTYSTKKYYLYLKCSILLCCTILLFMHAEFGCIFLNSLNVSCAQQTHTRSCKPGCYVHVSAHRRFIAVACPLNLPLSHTRTHTTSGGIPLSLSLSLGAASHPVPQGVASSVCCISLFTRIDANANFGSGCCNGNFRVIDLPKFYCCRFLWALSSPLLL